MPDEAIKPALRAALRFNEIGDRTPYEISFAQKANSGGSFGFMQGDLAAGQPIAHSTFRSAMAAAGMPQGKIDDLERRLSGKGIPPTVITPAEKQQIDAALLASKALVDAMDEAILGKVYGELDTCIAAAAGANRTIAPIAQLYVAMWVNMTGPPDKILDFLRGADLGVIVGETDIQTYLRATKYFRENPLNFPHMVASANKGAEQLPAA
jgi:hypothetical protein